MPICKYAAQIHVLSRAELYTYKNDYDSDFMREYKELNARGHQYINIPIETYCTVLHRPPATLWHDLKNVRQCQHLLKYLCEQH